MNKVKASSFSSYSHIFFLAVFIVMFAYLLLQPHSVFPDHWFPSRSANSLFKLLSFAWVLSELTNLMWSKRNLQTTKQDEGSYKIIAIATYTSLVVVILFRCFDIEVFSGSLQYVGLILFGAGILLRQWSIWVLGKYYTVQVQVGKNAKLVMEGPYKYIRHPSYSGYILSFVGFPLALGAWLGVLVAFIANWIAIQNRIRIEEQTLLNVFDSEYEEYEKKTWKLFPGF